jgi:hypothetical protein
LHGVRGRSVLECRTVRDGADDSRAHWEQSVIEGATLVVGDRFLDSPPQLADGPLDPHGQSARRSRTVRPGLADGPPGACGQSGWSSAEVLSPFLLEFRFGFGIVWGLS